MRSALALLLAVLAFTGCTLLPEDRVCTEIGCEDMLMVEIEAPPAEAFTLELVVAGEVAETFECPEGACPLVVFRGLVAEEVTLRLTWAGGTREETFRPAYQTHQPNGPDCPPVCRQAVIHLGVS